MASILRQIVAGPRAPHPEAGLDLCYVTERIVATSGPSSTYPQRAYRNPTDSLVKFLDYKHGKEWAIWEFRAEGTGYPDSEVYNRVWHYPWPDHHPPPFALIPNIMASMRNWLKEDKGRVVVVHCKAGKGRSGTVACSYLISEEGWEKEEALKRFTERRMRFGFGEGVSIPSQLRWVGYVERWARHGKHYIERKVEVCELHVYGLREGVKISVEGYVDDGRTIKQFHTFNRDERQVVKGKSKKSSAIADLVTEVMRWNQAKKQPEQTKSADASESDNEVKGVSPANDNETGGGCMDVIFRPKEPVVLPTSDINIDFERRNKASYGLTMVTAVAHVWFNAFFEGNGPENAGSADDSGIFEIEWDKMDGIKGSSQKGIRAFDKISVVWKAVERGEAAGAPVEINEPGEGEEVKQMQAADWRGANEERSGLGKELGLRTASPAVSADVSKASSIKSVSSTKAREQPVRGKQGENARMVTDHRKLAGEHMSDSQPDLSATPGASCAQQAFVSTERTESPLADESAPDEPSTSIKPKSKTTDLGDLAEQEQQSQTKH
ncbi:hypothetical protein L228DRAFT_246120 [Xylona heveae TC161]|uniref:phosphatidylinositol-3,4,5-trisphosphate 3-phosphatase n=1 Tax=Xylona heveae (strain CBS 132557 / TC161) TaxID=1328760 RepID=A0A165HDT3_XYLHT|nr:hypothetical protein L228DRAFT_246120 [Xylona heveae TC161]KZF23356.1 hypothetical protein L228DRAFT_246120 [Xylona heveae TC161]